MLKKGFAIVTMTILCVFSPLYSAINVLAQAPDDPAAELSSDQGTPPVESEVTPYTAEEFARLPDDQKKDVYFNSPELLPSGFDPIVYRDVFYSSPEN